jgi:hypothetical protein
MLLIVRPADDGHDMRGNWETTGRGSSTHVKKTAAIREARKRAKEGDTLEIRRTDGTVQDRKTIRNASPSSSSSNSSESGESSSVGLRPPSFGEDAYETGVEKFFK